MCEQSLGSRKNGPLNSSTGNTWPSGSCCVWSAWGSWSPGCVWHICHSHHCNLERPHQSHLFWVRHILPFSYCHRNDPDRPWLIEAYRMVCRGKDWIKNIELGAAQNEERNKMDPKVPSSRSRRVRMKKKKPNCINRSSIPQGTNDSHAWKRFNSPQTVISLLHS